MSMIGALRLLNSIEDGTTDSTELTTALTDTGKRSAFVGLLSQRGQARRLASSSVSTATILSSPLALAAVMQSDTAAQEFGNNSVSVGILKASTVAMQAATVNAPGMKAWADKFPAVTRSFGGIAGPIAEVAYGASMYVGVGSANTIVSSPDLVTWTARTNPGTAATFTSVAFAGGQFVAIGYTAGPAPVILTSPDGITWTSRTAPVGATVTTSQTVVYGAGRWVSLWAHSGAPKVFYSTDAIAWTSVTLSASAVANYTVVYRAGGGFVVNMANDAGMNAYRSADGVNWSAVTAGASAAGANYLAAGSDYFYISNQTPALNWYRSRDGIAWELMGTELAAMGFATGGRNNAIAVNGLLMRSNASEPGVRMSRDDGATWGSMAAYSVAMTNGRFAFANDRIFFLPTTGSIYVTHY